MMNAQFIFLIREIYNFFAHSVLRQAEYKAVLELVGFDEIGDDEEREEEGGDKRTKKKGSLKLISPSKTRWLVIADCCERILRQYDALKAMFEMVSLKEKDKITRDLVSTYKDPTTLCILKFVTPILVNMRVINCLFQKKKASNLEIYNELEEFFKSIANRVLKNSVVRVNDVHHLCDIKLTDFVTLSLDDVDYGESFLQSIRACLLYTSDAADE